jgi:hypothetical protein
VASDALGLFIANNEPTKQELEAAQANGETISGAVRKQTLKETPGETEALDDVNGTTSADITEASLETPVNPGDANKVEGNRFGTDTAGDTKSGSGETLGNSISMLIGGDEHGVQIGGTGAGQGNTIVNAGSGGVLIGGTRAHAPTVQVLGNAIYNNSTFGGLVEGLPGLGINLIGEEGSTVGLIGADPQDPTQPDAGPNALQNSPVLASASIAAGVLTVAGTLHGAPSTNYVVELFADQFANPYGAGEGQQLLGRLNLATDVSGHGSFSAEVGAPAATAQYVSATATTVPAGGGPGATSEFAVDAKIEAGSPPAGEAGTGPDPHLVAHRVRHRRGVSPRLAWSSSPVG